MFTRRWDERDVGVMTMSDMTEWSIRLLKALVIPWKTAARRVWVWRMGQHLACEVGNIDMKGLSIKTECAWR